MTDALKRQQAETAAFAASRPALQGPGLPGEL